MIFVFILLFLVGQSAVAQGYKVDGDVKGLDAPALLLLMQKQDGLSIERVAVTNGKFSFEGKVDEPFFLQILMLDEEDGFETTGKLTEFLIENSGIRIEGTSPAFEDVKVYGSKSDLVLKEYLKKDQALGDRWRLEKVNYDQAIENDEAELIEKLRDKLNGITAERVALLKSYVQRHNSSVIGALIPNFCTLGNVLTKEDYQEMYDMLTPEMQKTGYGSSILSRTLN